MANTISAGVTVVVLDPVALMVTLTSVQLVLSAVLLACISSAANAAPDYVKATVTVKTMSIKNLSLFFCTFSPPFIIIN